MLILPKQNLRFRTHQTHQGHMKRMNSRPTEQGALAPVNSCAQSTTMSHCKHWQTGGTQKGRWNVLWKAAMGRGAHTAGRGAGVGSERPGVRANQRVSKQRLMMDGVDTGGSSPALSRQHKPELPGWWVGCQPFVYGPQPISHLLYASESPDTSERATSSPPLVSPSLTVFLFHFLG